MSYDRKNRDSENIRFLSAIILITIIGAYLRFRDLSTASIRYDESIRLTWVNQGDLLESMNGEIGIGLFGPVFSLITQFTGQSDEFQLRLISAVSGTLLIPICGEIGRRGHSEFVGILAASFTSTSTTLIYQSQEFAPYSLVTTLIWGSYLIIESRGRSFEKLGIFSILFAYLLHFLALITVSMIIFSKFILEFNKHRYQNKSGRYSIIEILNSWFTDANHTKINRFLFAHVGMIIFIFPILIDTSSSPKAGGYIAETSSKFLGELFQWIFIGKIEFTSLLLLLSLTSLLMTTYYLVNSFTKKDQEYEHNSTFEFRIFISMVGVGTLSAMLLYSEFVKPIYLNRFLMFTFPSWIIITSIGFSDIYALILTRKGEEMDKYSTLETGPYTQIFAFIIIVFSVDWLVNDYEYYEYKHGNNTDIRGASEFALDHDWDEGEILVVSTAMFSFDYYLSDSNPDLTVDFGSDLRVNQVAYSEIREKNPNQVLYLVGHNSQLHTDQEWINYLEDEGYMVVGKKEFHQASAYILER